MAKYEVKSFMTIKIHILFTVIIIYHYHLSLPLPVLLLHWNVKLIKPQKMASDASGPQGGGRVGTFIWTRQKSC